MTNASSLDPLDGDHLIGVTVVALVGSESLPTERGGKEGLPAPLDGAACRPGETTLQSRKLRTCLCVAEPKDESATSDMLPEGSLNFLASIAGGGGVAGV